MTHISKDDGMEFLIEKFEEIETPNGDGWGGVINIYGQGSEKCAALAKEIAIGFIEFIERNATCVVGNDPFKWEIELPDLTKEYCTSEELFQSYLNTLIQ